MYYYIFDGSFEGFLSVIFDTYATGRQPSAISPKRPEHLPLFAEEVAIVTDKKKAARVAAGIKKNLGAEAYQHVYYCLLSAHPDACLCAYAYLRFGFAEGGKSTDCRLDKKEVETAHRISKEVGIERHRLLGLLRFSQRGLAMYAAISPVHDVLELIAPHFCRRYSGLVWVIHDLGREKAVFYNGRNWSINSLPAFAVPDKESDPFVELWRQYFSAINIQERRNPRQQKQYMPQRYWQHLPEKEPKPVTKF